MNKKQATQKMLAAARSPEARAKAAATLKITLARKRAEAEAASRPQRTVIERLGDSQLDTNSHLRLRLAERLLVILERLV